MLTEERHPVTSCQRAGRKYWRDKKFKKRGKKRTKSDIIKEIKLENSLKKGGDNMPPKGKGDYLIAIIGEAIKSGQLLTDNRESRKKYYEENQGRLLGIDFDDFERWVLCASFNL